MTDNSPRVIITAKYLVEMFGHLDDEMMIFILTPFTLSDASRAISYLNERIAEVESMKDAPGKTGAAEAWMHIKSAYEKMSPVERKRVAKELILEMASHIKNKADL